MNWGFLGPKQDDNPDAATAPAVNEDKRGGVTWETAEIGKAVNSQNFYFENIPAVGEIRSMGFRVNGLYARTIGQVLETVK